MPTSATEREALRHLYDGDYPGHCESITNGLGPIKAHCRICDKRLARIAQEIDHERRIREDDHSVEWLRIAA